MNPWTIYFLERFRPYFFLTVIFGMALSGVLIGGNLFRPTSFMISCMTIFYVGFVLRLQNDVKDMEKDRIAYPDRALPRGVIQKETAANVVLVLEWGLACYGVLLFLVYQGNTRIALLLTAAYFWLLLNDFYAKNWMERHPISRGFIGQGFIFFLTILVVSFGRPEVAFSLSGLSYALVNFAAFYTFEICRKLDPYSHPITLSIVHFYGYKVAFRLLCLLLLLSALGALALGVEFLLWPAEIAVLLSLIILFKDPKRYVLAKTASALSLLLHTFAGVIQYFQLNGAN